MQLGTSTVTGTLLTTGYPCFDSSDRVTNTVMPVQVTLLLQFALLTVELGYNESGGRGERDPRAADRADRNEASPVLFTGLRGGPLLRGREGAPRLSRINRKSSLKP
jgi:hypothetical protein